MVFNNLLLNIRTSFTIRNVCYDDDDDDGDHNDDQSVRKLKHGVGRSQMISFVRTVRFAAT
jgi:hypothetical protein